MTTYADAKIALTNLLQSGGRGHVTPELLDAAVQLVTDSLKAEVLSSADLGVTVQAYSANLASWAGIAPSAKLSKAGDTMTGALTLAADPTSALHAATKQYVDGLVQGLDPKGSVRCATTANITLSGAQTIDGVSAIAGDRVLVKNQSTASQNGIYVVAAGSWTRATDMDAWTEVPGAFCFVEEGSTNADLGFICTSNAGGTLGSTSIAWTTFANLTAVASFNGRTGAVSPANDDYAVTQLAAIAANSIVGNNTGSSARPIVMTVAQLKTLLALAVADVSGAAALAGNQTLTGGFVATEYDHGTVTTGTVTPAPANGQMQKLTANGAFTLAPPSASGSYTIILDITNGASAGAITTSSFTKVTGDAFTTTNAHKFSCYIKKGVAGTHLHVQAMQ